MNVEELIRRLQQLDPQTIIVMSSDSEGNEYSPLAGMALGWYAPESTWGGMFRNDDNDEPDEGELEALCLWPIN